MSVLFLVRNLIKNCNFVVYSKQNLNTWKNCNLSIRVPKNYVNITYRSSSTIKFETVHLLERTSLVDLSDKKALDSLQSSIAFASRILSIDTCMVDPLYTVLEDEDLQLREDKVIESQLRKDILQTSKITEEDYFVAPPGNIVLEKVEANYTD